MMKMIRLKKKKKAARETADKKAETVDKATRIIEKYKGRKRGIVELLQETSVEFSYLPEEVIKKASEELEVPLTQLYSLATFYKSFKLSPPGKHTIRVCMGTACHVRGAPRILEEIERKLKIKSGGTTDDLNFTLETVNCLGACALGPLMVVDGKYFGKITPGRVEKVLKEYRD